MDNLDRIAAENYMPNNLDMLYARVPTNGIVSIEFKFKKYNFRLKIMRNSVNTNINFALNISIKHFSTMIN